MAAIATTPGHFLGADGRAQARVDVGESGGARRLMRERVGACRKRARRGERHRGFQDLAAVWTADDAHRAFWSPYALQQAEQIGRLQLHAQILCFEHDLVRKPVSTFRDHAAASPLRALKLHFVSIVHDLVVAPCGGMTGKAVSYAYRRFIDRTGLDHIGPFGGNLFRGLVARAHDGDVAGAIVMVIVVSLATTSSPRLAAACASPALASLTQPLRRPFLGEPFVLCVRQQLFGGAPAGAKYIAEFFRQRRRQTRCNGYVCQATFPARRSASRSPNGRVRRRAICPRRPSHRAL